ncbi:MAG: hypothetical protein JWN67_4288 [Actinomycetia bacterium]|nr:hypothetical protein [Actinomycetes bacterium]
MERGRRHWWQVDHLADDEPPDDVALDDVVEEPVEERHDMVEYDLSDWRLEQGTALVEQLEIEHIPNQWVGRHLTVPGAHEAKVDELVDLFDALPDEAPADDVEYVFEEWTPQQCQQLVDRLLELDIACTWDGYLLSVGEADEATVDAEVLKIDPSFPVGDGDGDGEEEPPEEPRPLLGGWGPVVGAIADGLGNIGR